MPHRSVRVVVRDRRPLVTSSQATVDEAARMMKKSKASAVMVVDDERPLGIFTAHDALFRVLAAGRDPHATKIASVMTRNPKTVDPDKPFGYALFLMYEGGFHHVPVVENGRLLGVVSARDALGPELREFSEEMLSRDHIGEILG